MKKQNEEGSKNDGREHVNIVFIGHVDSGKSTICGNILYIMGLVDERAIAKYEREAKEKNRDSWYLAYIMDTNEEERERGKTVEVGKAQFNTPHKRYTLFDAPGHKNFVPNMITGAAQADVSVLVISARKGEFETGFEKGGQTREHALLAKTLGVKTMIVAINKMDDSTVEWDKERFDYCKNKLLPFLKNCGYNTKKSVEFIPVSGLKGLNLKESLSPQICDWYKGPPLLELLDTLPPVARNENAPVRIPVYDRYKEGKFLFVLGKVEAGHCTAGNYILMPIGLSVECVGVLNDGEEVESSRPGDNVALKLKDIEECVVHSGFVLCCPESPCKRTMEFDAQIAILTLLEHKPLLTAGYTCVLHVHTLIVECIISELISEVQKDTGKISKKRPVYIRSGGMVICRIQVDRTIALELFENFQQLGRFTLRDEQRTIAMGKVIKIKELDSYIDPENTQK